MSIPFDPSQKHILIIEDDVTFLEHTQSALKAEGYQVTVATNGKDGWDVVKAIPVHIVLLDLVMPGEDGIWFLETVRDSVEYTNLPVVVFTNLSHGEKIGRAVVKGVSRLLIKGETSMRELTQTIREVLISS